MGFCVFGRFLGGSVLGGGRGFGARGVAGLEGDLARVTDDVGDAGGGVLNLWRILLTCVVVVLLALHRIQSGSIP